MYDAAYIVSFWFAELAVVGVVRMESQSLPLPLRTVESVVIWLLGEVDPPFERRY
jgi:hypothetical protein